MTTKHRVEIRPNREITRYATLAGTSGASPLMVVASASGPLTWADKAKAYYKQVIAVVGYVVVALNSVIGLVGLVPQYGEKSASAVSLAVGFLTTLLVVLKANETWIDTL